jgi:hypothetical protein
MLKQNFIIILKLLYSHLTLKGHKDLKDPEGIIYIPFITSYHLVNYKIRSQNIKIMNNIISLKYNKRKIKYNQI